MGCVCRRVSGILFQHFKYIFKGFKKPITNSIANIIYSWVSKKSLYFQAVRTSSIGGEPIMEGTQVMFNLWAINNDPREWNNPESFDPSRWLDESGNCIEGQYKLIEY